MPFVICAKRIIEISFKPVVDIITPKKMINIQVNLKCNDFKFDGVQNNHIQQKQQQEEL